MQVQIIGPDGEDVIVVDQRQLYRCDSESARLPLESVQCQPVFSVFGGCRSKYGWPARDAIQEALRKIEID